MSTKRAHAGPRAAYRRAAARMTSAGTPHSGLAVSGVQAAINAVHTSAATAADTDWRQVVALYDQLRSESCPAAKAVLPKTLKDLSAAADIARRARSSRASSSSAACNASVSPAPTGTLSATASGSSANQPTSLTTTGRSGGSTTMASRSCRSA